MRAYPLVVAAIAALLASGCGESEAEKPDIVAEYVQSNEVLNDPFATEACCEDRMAQLAAMGSPDAVVGRVLGVAPCEGYCELNDAESDAVRELAGAGPELYVRGFLVKHEDGLLEAASVLVARGEESTVIIDTDGATYEDLDDFRAGNDRFESEDWLLIAEDVTSISDDGSPIVTVTARITPPLVWWLIGGGAAVVVALVAAAVVRARFRRRRIGLADSPRPDSPA